MNSEMNSENNILEKFISECCTRSEFSETRTSDLYNRFVSFCTEKGRPALSLRAFGEQLNDHGIEKKRRPNGIYCLGIKVKEEENLNENEENLQDINIDEDSNLSLLRSRLEEIQELQRMMSPLHSLTPEKVVAGVAVAGAGVAMLETFAPGSTKSLLSRENIHSFFTILGDELSNRNALLKSIDWVE